MNATTNTTSATIQQLAAAYVPQSFTRKDLRGNWKSTCDFELPRSRVLRISTHKTDSGKLVTSASVHERKGGFETFVMFQDYHQNLIVQKVRVTEKAVSEQQTRALREFLPSVREAVNAQYGFTAEELAA